MVHREQIMKAKTQVHGSGISAGRATHGGLAAGQRAHERGHRGVLEAA